MTQHNFVHLDEGDTVGASIQTQGSRTYPVLQFGNAMNMFPSVLQLRQIIAACNHALHEMGEPLETPAPVDESEESFSTRVSENPNDAWLSVEKDSTPGFPFWVDGLGVENPPRFKTFPEARDYVFEYLTENSVEPTE